MSEYLFYEETPNSHLSNSIIYSYDLKWAPDIQSFISDTNPNKFFYIWENQLRYNIDDWIDKVPNIIRLNHKIRIFLDISTGEISTGHYEKFVKQMELLGLNRFVILVNSQFEYDQWHSILGEDKPLIILINRNEIHFYENLLTSRKPKRFLFLSRRFTPDRFFIFLDLHRRGILDNSHYTFGTHNSVYTAIPDYTSKTSEEISSSFHNHFYSDHRPFVREVKDYFDRNKENILSELPKFIGTFSNQDPSQIGNMFNESYVSLLIESQLSSNPNSYHPTEKLFKCFYYKHPFVVYSTPQFLQHTKLSGYQTFDIFDETYDHIEDTISRIKQINDYVEYLNGLDEISFLKIVRQCFPSIKHNHNRLTERLQDFHSNIIMNKTTEQQIHKIFMNSKEFENYSIVMQRS